MKFVLFLNWNNSEVGSVKAHMVMALSQLQT